MRLLILIIICFSAHISHARQNTGNTKYVGKYEANGLVVQVAVINNSLTLVVPGAPVQELKAIGKNKFKTSASSDEVFIFAAIDHPQHFSFYCPKQPMVKSNSHPFFK